MARATAGKGRRRGTEVQDGAGESTASMGCKRICRCSSSGSRSRSGCSAGSRTGSRQPQGTGSRSSSGCRSRSRAGPQQDAVCDAVAVCDADVGECGGGHGKAGSQQAARSRSQQAATLSREGSSSRSRAGPQQDAVCDAVPVCEGGGGECGSGHPGAGSQRAARTRSQQAATLKLAAEDRGGKHNEKVRDGARDLAMDVG